jgi:hypothetical protein
MSEKQTWETAPGTPGAILSALHEAAKSLGVLATRASKEAKIPSYKATEDVENAVFPALQQVGVVTALSGANAVVHQGKAAQVDITVRFQAVADGSYVDHTLTGFAQTPMGRCLSAATTAARKQILCMALQLVTAESESAPQWGPDDASDAAKAWYGELRNAASMEDLRAARVPADASEDEIAYGRHLFAARRDDLKTLDAGAYTAELARKGRAK